MLLLGILWEGSEEIGTNDVAPPQVLQLLAWAIVPDFGTIGLIFKDILFLILKRRFHSGQ